MDFPAEHRRQLHSTNPLGHLNRMIGHRTDVVSPYCSCSDKPSLVGKHGVPFVSGCRRRRSPFCLSYDEEDGVSCLFDETVPTFVFFEWALIAQTWRSLRQRPHHLARVLARKGFQVVFVEPPSTDGVENLSMMPLEDGVFYVKPPANLSTGESTWWQQLNTLLPKAPWVIHHPVWTPILRQYLASARTIVYDCMDEWSEFPGSAPEVAAWETELAAKVDLVGCQWCRRFFRICSYSMTLPLL